MSFFCASSSFCRMIAPRICSFTSSTERLARADRAAAPHDREVAPSATGSGAISPSRHRLGRFAGSPDRPSAPLRSTCRRARRSRGCRRACSSPCRGCARARACSSAGRRDPSSPPRGPSAPLPASHRDAPDLVALRRVVVRFVRVVIGLHVLGGDGAGVPSACACARNVACARARSRSHRVGTACRRAAPPRPARKAHRGRSPVEERATNLLVRRAERAELERRDLRHAVFDLADGDRALADAKRHRARAAARSAHRRAQRRTRQERRR